MSFPRKLFFLLSFLFLTQFLESKNSLQKILFRFLRTSKKVAMSCCPPNSEPFLEDTYVNNGCIVTLEDYNEFYASGDANATSAVIIIPDIWGWRSGRTRNIADLFANAGELI
jgi:hypothetical protein